MLKKEIALGASKKIVANLIDESMHKSKMQTPEGRLDFLIARVDTLEKLTAYLYTKLQKEEESCAYNETQQDIVMAVTENISNLPAGELNKDNIPIDTLLIGVSLGKPYILTVNRYNYTIGTHTYDTLSAAAEGVSGNRRSGWSFWKTSDGRTAKEAFNNRN